MVCHVYSHISVRVEMCEHSYLVSYTGIADAQTKDTVLPPSAVGSFKFGNSGPKLGEEDMSGAL